MATSGTALYPGTSVFPNTNVFPGQGDSPLIRCLLSFDDVSDADPAYADVTPDMRSYSVTRGRGSELDEFDAGTATVVFDDRDRSFDPTSNASIRPFNRLWLFVEWSGEVHDLFKGYVQSWNEAWDQSGIVDATSTAVAADEFTVLASIALPTTNPPRDSYAAVITDEGPAGYWSFNEDSSEIAFFDPLDVSTAQSEATSAPEESSAPLRRTDRRAFPAKPRRRP